MKLTPSVLAVLATMTGAQSFTAASLFVIPAIAPEIANDLGVSTTLVGLQVSIVYFGAMTASIIAGGFSTRWGPTRTLQISLALGALGLGLATTQFISAIAIGSVLIGWGYGLAGPPAGQILEAVASEHNRKFLFSIKQTSVPLGGVLAGLFGPSLSLFLGWQWTLIAFGIASLVVGALIQPYAAQHDQDRNFKYPLMTTPLSDIALVLRGVKLRWITLSGFFFAATQFTLTTYLVSLLVQDLGFGLVAAGFCLSIFQISAVLGRIILGIIADRLQSGIGLLFITYLIGTCLVTLLVFMSDKWPVPLIYLCLIFLGATGAGWNGMFVGEIVALAPRQTTARAIGGAFVFIFAGALVGPSLFVAAYSQIGIYTHTISIIAFSAAIGCMCCFMAVHADLVSTEKSVLK